MRKILLVLAWVVALVVFGLFATGCSTRTAGHAFVPGYTTFVTAQDTAMELRERELETRTREAVQLLGTDGGAELRINMTDLPGWFSGLAQEFSLDPVVAVCRVVWDTVKGFGLYKLYDYGKDKLEEADEEDKPKANKDMPGNGRSDVNIVGQNSEIQIQGKDTDNLNINVVNSTVDITGIHEEEEKKEDGAAP